MKVGRTAAVSDSAATLPEGRSASVHLYFRFKLSVSASLLREPSRVTILMRTAAPLTCAGTSSVTFCRVPAFAIGAVLGLSLPHAEPSRLPQATLPRLPPPQAASVAVMAMRHTPKRALRGMRLVWWGVFMSVLGYLQDGLVMLMVSGYFRAVFLCTS